jgi:hypothetical protein
MVQTGDGLDIQIIKSSAHGRSTKDRRRRHRIHPFKSFDRCGVRYAQAFPVCTSTVLPRSRPRVSSSRLLDTLFVNTRSLICVVSCCPTRSCQQKTRFCFSSRVVRRSCGACASRRKTETAPCIHGSDNDSRDRHVGQPWPPTGSHSHRSALPPFFLIL